MSTDRFARFVLPVGLTLLLVSLVRTAWLSDDAYITFRTVDNFLHGYGLVWNASERVQTYTHPLWLALLTPAFALTGEVYYTTLVLSVLVTCTAVVLLGRLASTPWNLAVCFAALLSSKAFIDFSTSGLENPLTHVLLLVFAWIWWDAPEGPTRVGRLSLTAALCLLNRLDLAPLVAPALAYEAWQSAARRPGLRRAIVPAIVGFLPLVAWEVFAMLYYGSPFPNTAYAKLNTVLTATARIGHGVEYLRRTLTGDPVTLVAMAAACVVPARRPRAWLPRFAPAADRSASPTGRSTPRDEDTRAGLGRDWPLVAGIALFLLYVLRIGGDWMMGRFLTPPFVLAVALLARASWAMSRRAGLAAAAAVILVGLLATWEPAILSGYGYSYANNLLHGRHTQRPMDDETKTFLLGVMDERRYYYEATGLLKSIHAQPRPRYEWSVDGLRLRARGAGVTVAINIGMLGYFAGPRVHVIDMLGLGDPLLARLPGGDARSPMGHFPRAIPTGYVETIESGQNRLANADLAAYYDRLHVVIAAPFWSGDRFVTLARLLAGRYDDLLARYVNAARRA
jgi:arabinofuranosyltransferase